MPFTLPNDIARPRKGHPQGVDFFFTLTRDSRLADRCHRSSHSNGGNSISGMLCDGSSSLPIAGRLGMEMTLVLKAHNPYPNKQDDWTLALSILHQQDL